MVNLQWAEVEPQCKPMLELVNLCKTYQLGSEKVLAVNNVNLKVYENEFVAIMGKSGSGKSTMMNILGCLDRPTSGSYFLDQVDVAKMKDSQLATVRNRKIGFVFQSFNLLPKLTSIQNVELPMMYAGASAKIRRKKALKALEIVDLKDRINHKPNELSGGQRQRVAIARSLANDPVIFLADEPTGNLDSRSTNEIMGIFQKLNDEGATIIMVTHEPDVAQFTKRIVTFKDGEIISDSPVKNRIMLIK